MLKPVSPSCLILGWAVVGFGTLIVSVVHAPFSIPALVMTLGVVPGIATMGCPMVRRQMVSDKSSLGRDIGSGWGK